MSPHASPKRQSTQQPLLRALDAGTTHAIRRCGCSRGERENSSVAASPKRQSTQQPLLRALDAGTTHAIRRVGIRVESFGIEDTMICIKTSSGGKWHYLHKARTLCGARGRETGRRDLGLATHGKEICRDCDRELRLLGRATRRARDLRAAALRDAVIYRPLHREYFEMSVRHVNKASL